MNDHVKKTIDVYDLIAEDYAKKIDIYAPKQEQQKFLSLFPQNALILDAGCGPGRDSKYFVKQGVQVVGIDLSKKLLKIAKKRVPQAHFEKQDLRNLSFNREYFDGIWACASLHHLQRKEVPPVIRKFFEILKPDGILFILVKEGSGEEDVIESLFSGLPRHFVYFRLEELTKMLENIGFKIEKIYTYREEDRRKGRSDLVWLTSFSRKPHAKVLSG